jgi:UDP-N-acetyl-D-glucosamine dehydrogenase
MDYDDLLNRIRSKQAIVGIVGLGYVGLPLARAFTTAGFSVLGFDCDPRRVAQLQLGQSYLRHFSDGELRSMQARGLESTDRFDRLHEPDAIIVCVPTPLTSAREPDLTHVTDVTRVVAAHLRRAQLIVLESTTYPTTTRHVVLPLLQESGLQAGKDYFLAYSPEREDPGNPHYSAETIPKVVSGLDTASLELAVSLYTEVVTQVVPVSSLEVAEACKILENTYRAVNIALVNELKVVYDRMGINVWEVIEAAKTKPFGFQAFYPSPGLGGHCIPVDPFYLTWIARKHGLSTRFIELAGEVNTAMPRYVLGKVTDALNDRGKPVRGSKILLLGMAYKKDVDDIRESPGLKLMELLQKKGAVVTFHDPYVHCLPRIEGESVQCLQRQTLTEELLQDQDTVVIVTDHSAYNWNWIVNHSNLVIDTRNAARDVPGRRDRIVLA